MDNASKYMIMRKAVSNNLRALITCKDVLALMGQTKKGGKERVAVSWGQAEERAWNTSKRKPNTISGGIEATMGHPFFRWWRRRR